MPLLLLDDVSPEFARVGQALGFDVHEVSTGVAANGAHEYAVLISQGMTEERYRQLFELARRHNVTLLNDPEQFVRARSLRLEGTRLWRLFVLDADVVAGGALTTDADADADEADFGALARTTAARLAVPWLRIDVGRLEDGSWQVLETGDPSDGVPTRVSMNSLLTGVLHGLAGRLGC